MKSIEQELEQVKEEIAKCFNDSFFIDEIKNFVLGNSKFIRSILTVLYLKANEKEISSDAYKLIASAEILHNASLLHDDVIDEAEIRRGEKTLAKRFSSKLSILAGDYLLSKAIAKLSNKEEALLDFQRCAEKMIEAEFEQYSLRGNFPTEVEYLKICKQKTALLFATVLKTTAQLFDLDEEKAFKFGEIYGLCFQIKNDLEKTSAQVDLQNGIYTAKDIFGIEKTALLLDNYKAEMRDLLANIPQNIYKEELEDLVNKL